MQELYDYKKRFILYVDDEKKSLKYFERAFGEVFRILTASSAREGMQLIEKHGAEIGVLMTDQRMPEMTGVELLEKARAQRPRMVRILATAYTDLDAAIEAVNTGAIYKYVSKPWDIPELETTLKRGLEFYLVQEERDGLMAEKLSALHNIMIADRVISLGVVAAGLGHYVRNALVAVRTFLDLAPDKLAEENIDLSQTQNPNFWSEFYGHVQEQVRRISDMLADLGGANVSPREFEDEVRLAEVINGVVEASADALAGKDLTVEVNIPEDLPPLTVNRAKFERLFELFVRDEVVSLSAGGTIRIDAAVETQDEGGWVRVVIEDETARIPEEGLRRLFDPFFARSDDPKEYGINLMICYFIVYHHGGRVDVQSRDGGGVTFALRFPVGMPPESGVRDDEEFIAKVVANEKLWDRLLSGI